MGISILLIDGYDKETKTNDICSFEKGKEKIGK